MSLKHTIIRKLDVYAGAFEAAAEYCEKNRHYRMADENRIAARAYRKALKAVEDAFSEKATVKIATKRIEGTC